MALKLITETLFSDLNVISEGVEKNGNKTLYISGPYMQADIKNKNGRVYPYEVLKEEVERYTKEKINTKQALGELQHACFNDNNFEVMTEKGWKWFKDITLEDIILNLNVENRTIEQDNIEKIIDDDFKGVVIGLKSNQIDTCVTTNHKWLFQNDSGTITLEETKDIIEWMLQDKGKIVLDFNDNIPVLIDKDKLEVSMKYHYGRIYCLSMKNNKNFYVRQNGYVFWTGNSSPAVNLERACHLVQSLTIDDDGVVTGKSKILDTPMGRIVRSLLEEGVKLGVSSRGLGTMQEGTHTVNDDFHLVCIDVVSEPSAPDCFVDGILENKEYIISGNVIMEAAIYDMKNKIDKKASRENVLEAIDLFMKNLKGVL